MIYSRRCGVTGKGMNQGWVFGIGEMYVKNKEDAEKVASQYGFNTLKEVIEEGLAVRKEWNPLEEDTWYTENGTLVKSKKFTLIVGDISFFDPDVDEEYKAVVHSINGVHAFYDEDTAEEVAEFIIDKTGDGYIILESYSGKIEYQEEEIKNK